MTCQQNGCTEEATRVVYWPGKETRQCEPHAAKAKALGRFMGFDVPVLVIGVQVAGEEEETQ